MVRVLSSDLKELHQRRVTVHDEEFDLDIELSIVDLFTSDSCHILAGELSRLIEGSDVIAIHAAGEWPGGYLIHAGVAVGEQVLDIEGVHEAELWIERWGRGLEIEVTRQAPADHSMIADTVVVNTARAVAQMLCEVPEFKSLKIACPQL